MCWQAVALIQIVYNDGMKNESMWDHKKRRD